MNATLKSALICAASVYASAHAANGPFPHGYGIASQGFGGIGYTAPEESYMAAGNPALLLDLGTRLDVGVDWFKVSPGGRIEGNAVGPDKNFEARGISNYFIPQAGYVRPLGERAAFGVTAFSAGLGPDYEQSPYARFGGDARASNLLIQSGIALALAQRVSERQTLGLSANLAYQTLRVRGIGVFSGASLMPGKFSDQGKDGAFGIGFTLGWQYKPQPWVEFGAAYKSKTWVERFEGYAGLIPEQGRLEFPAMYGGGFAVRPHADWTVALEAQRVEYASSAGFGNRLSQFTREGELFGSDQGPGFGWRDQNVYKFGVRWAATPALTLRAGFQISTQLVPASETFLGFLAPATSRRHYSIGASYALGNWDVAAYTALVGRVKLDGENSIPDVPFGGGEADNQFNIYPAGLSISRRFGGPAAAGNGT